jgi:hypothetical protein
LGQASSLIHKGGALESRMRLPCSISAVHDEEDRRDDSGDAPNSIKPYAETAENAGKRELVGAPEPLRVIQLSKTDRIAEAILDKSDYLYHYEISSGYGSRPA